MIRKGYPGILFYITSCHQISHGLQIMKDPEMILNVP